MKIKLKTDVKFAREVFHHIVETSEYTFIFCISTWTPAGTQTGCSLFKPEINSCYIYYKCKNYLESSLWTDPCVWSQEWEKSFINIDTFYSDYFIHVVWFDLYFKNKIWQKSIEGNRGSKSMTTKTSDTPNSYILFQLVTHSNLHIVFKESRDSTAVQQNICHLMQISCKCVFNTFVKHKHI